MLVFHTAKKEILKHKMAARFLYFSRLDGNMNMHMFINTPNFNIILNNLHSSFALKSYIIKFIFALIFL